SASRGSACHHQRAADLTMWASRRAADLQRLVSEKKPEAIAKVRKYQPAAYMKICALLVPREMKLEHSSGVKAMSDEHLIERTLEVIEEMIAQRDAAANAKVIEGEAMPSLPAPTAVNAKSL